LIELEGTSNAISLDICDNGCGFDRSDVPAGRFGLRGIEERARLFGGRALIDSALGRGTRIHVELPCDVREAQLPQVDESTSEMEKLPVS
jgi:signal transduction histidine kinase